MIKIKRILSVMAIVAFIFMPLIATMPSSAGALILNEDPNQNNISLPNNEPTSSTVETGMKYFFAVAALLSVLFVAIGGFKYTVSGGDSQSTQSAKNTILYAVIGLAISVLAFVIVQFVIGQI